MSDIDLPANAKDILSRLKKQYRTEFDDLRLRDRHLKILQVSDIEPLLNGMDPFEDVSSFPF